MNAAIIVATVALVAAILWLALRKTALPEAPEDLQRIGAAKRRAGTRPSAPATQKKSSTRPKPASPPQATEALEPTGALRQAPRARDIDGLRRGMAKMRESGGIFGRLKDIFVGKKELDPRLLDALEEVLITSDVGTTTTARLLDSIRDGLAKNQLADSEKVWGALRERATELLDLPGGGGIREEATPTVVLMVGVNGAGKTTTIGKLATKFSEQGKKVMIVAGDTFRAAAVQQLQAWGDRAGCEVFTTKEGADPASVVFEAVTKAVAEKHDIVLCDTAGRLHTKSNLMDEIRKVHRTAQKVLDGAPHEVLLVVDGTTGQNAIQQAAEFGNALPLTGIVLTKLDGTAKGGVVLAIANEQRLPVRYIGVGERAQDLRDFDAAEFVEALLGGNDDDARAA